MGSLINTRAAAAMLGLSPATLESWRMRGDRRLPWVKLGRAVRYAPEHVEQFARTGSADRQAAAP